MEAHLPQAALKLLALLCLCDCASGRTAPATFQVGYEAGRLYGGSLASGTSPLLGGRVQLDDDIANGFWVGTQLTSTWGLELSRRRCSTDLIEPRPGIWAPQPKVASLTDTVLEVAARRTYPLGQFHPYWRIGAGLASLEISPSEAPRQRLRRASLGAGGGAMFWVSPWLGFRFDVRVHAIYLGTRGAGQDQGSLDPGRWLRTQEVLAGLALSF